MENQTKLRLVKMEDKVEDIISIASYKQKHLSRLHEAALRKRAEIHLKCDRLEKAMKRIEVEYNQQLQNLRKLQQEVNSIEYKILMGRIERER